MRISALLGSGAALALAFAAHAAAAGAPMSYGAPVRGQCGPAGCGTPGPVGFGPGQVTNEDYPPNAAPGQCFTKVLVPEVTQAVSEHVMVAPEKTEIKVIPGLPHSEEKSVMVKEETVELISVPATYRTVTETVTVRPGYNRTETIPAEYDTITERVKVKDGYTAWRPGSTVAGYAPGSAVTRPSGVYGQGVIEGNPGYGGLPTRVLPTGEVLCLVEVPPEFRNVTKQVLRTPARTVEIPVPPETRIVTRQVIDVPAHTEKREIPAVFENVKITVRSPDTTENVVIPPVFRDYTRTNIVSPSHFEWKQVDCRTEVVHSTNVPPPAVRHYAPPVHSYSEVAKPRIVHRKAPVHIAPPPPPPPAPLKHGKQCHTTTVCDGEKVSELTPPTTLGPIMPAHAIAPAYTKDLVGSAPAPETATYPVATRGGDQAVANLQGALASHGYYAGPQNGLFTQDTLHAMVKYQNDNHLAAGRYTGETANALGVASR